MRLGFIGAGAMSGAIARGLRASGDTETQIVLFDVNADGARALATEVSGTVADSIASLTREADIALLGVKPHVQTAVLAEIAEATAGQSSDRLALLSIAAGRSLASIASDLKAAGAERIPALIRVMPNVNAQIGLSMSAIAYTDDVPGHVRQEAKRVFDAVGECLELSEDHFAEFAALAGCSPAWFFQIADGFARAGVKYGLTKQQALASITQAMLGSARMIQLSQSEGVNPSALIDRVCSPGGTTVAGLLAAQEAGLDTALVKAVDAAVTRDHELGN